MGLCRRLSIPSSQVGDELFNIYGCALWCWTPVSAVSIPGKKEPMVAIDDITGLISLVQAGVVEIHPWGSTIYKLAKPDRLVFDLAPGENVPWMVVIEAGCPRGPKRCRRVSRE